MKSRFISLFTFITLSTLLPSLYSHAEEFDQDPAAFSENSEFGDFSDQNESTDEQMGPDNSDPSLYDESFSTDTQLEEDLESSDQETYVDSENYNEGEQDLESAQDPIAAQDPALEQNNYDENFNPDESLSLNFDE